LPPFFSGLGVLRNIKQIVVTEVTFPALKFQGLRGRW